MAARAAAEKAAHAWRDQLHAAQDALAAEQRRQATAAAALAAQATELSDAQAAYSQVPAVRVGVPPLVTVPRPQAAKEAQAAAETIAAFSARCDALERHFAATLLPHAASPPASTSAPPADLCAFCGLPTSSTAHALLAIVAARAALAAAEDRGKAAAAAAAKDRAALAALAAKYQALARQLPPMVHTRPSFAFFPPFSLTRSLRGEGQPDRSAAGNSAAAAATTATAMAMATRRADDADRRVALAAVRAAVPHL